LFVLLLGASVGDGNNRSLQS